MAVYPLNKFNKKGDVLYPQTSYYSDEYAKTRLDWYLTDTFRSDEHGKHCKVYQLHSSKPRAFADFMKNDIMCPDCGKRMYPYANAENHHDLAYYYCKQCHEK